MSVRFPDLLVPWSCSGEKGYPDQAARHLAELRAILDKQEPAYRL